MNYIEMQTAIFVKKIETRISKLEKEIQRLEKQHDKKMEKWHKRRRRSCTRRESDREESDAIVEMMNVITEKRREVLTLRTIIEQIQELPIAQLHYSVLYCKECKSEILTIGQMEEGWHQCPVCGKMVHGGAGVKVMEVGKTQYMERNGSKFTRHFKWEEIT